jgi:hypothetical protein
MPHFDHDNIQHCEFYVSLGKGDSETRYQVPVDTSVQSALKEMFRETIHRINKVREADGFEEYSPAQKYGATDAVHCSLESEFAEMPRLLLTETGIDETSNAISDLKNISYYYVIAVDSANRKMLGVRRASQFKGVLQSKLLHWARVDNSLKLVDVETFRLDSDFDYVAFDEMLWALRPTGLEFTANLTEAVKAAAPTAAAEVMTRVSFLNLESLGTYAAKHPRAARYLAAVRARDDLEEISEPLLTAYCQDSDIDFTVENGKMIPAKGQEILFLEVLDRRIFTAELIPDKKERYEAPNRRDV